jgi:hypothetical protein
VNLERWPQISRVFHVALARHESQRSAVLSDACAGDDALCHEVASLLDQQKDAEGFYAALWKSSIGASSWFIQPASATRTKRSGYD